MHSWPTPTTRLKLILISLVIVAGAVPAMARERYNAWQATNPFTQTAWISSDISLSTQADLDYFLRSGLNTFWDGVRSGSSALQHTNSNGVPTIVMAYHMDRPNLEGFIKDFNKARAAHKNLVGVALGDEVRSSLGPGGVAHMRAIRDWIVQNPDPAISRLLTLSSVPGGQEISHSKAGQEDLTETFEKIQPDVACLQIYPVGGGFVTPHYYSSLEWLAVWSRKHNAPLWCWLEGGPSSGAGASQVDPPSAERRL